jgi:glycosyltransferase involved in cell wall biosynthesis
MKVVFDSQIFTMQEYGGISRYICSLVNHLAQLDGLDARILAPLHLNTYLANMPKELVFGKKVRLIPEIGRRLRAVNHFLARPVINKFRPEILHQTYYMPDASVAPFARRVLTVHDMIHERYGDMFPARDRTTSSKEASAKRADHVICVSENTRKDLLELFDLPENKVSVIHLGFDSLQESTTQKADDKPYIFYVGHRSGYKNFESFLRAYASSFWLRENFNVVCFGGGIFSSAELMLFSDLKLSVNQVLQRSGSDVELADCYRDASLFVYPSLYEGFGIPPLEAMSMDCPVVCSNVSSIPEVVGNAGEYFNPLDLNSMRYALEEVLTSVTRRAELIKNGQQRCALFSWQRCAAETAVIYKGLM